MSCIVSRLELDAEDANTLREWMATGCVGHGRKVSGEDMARALRAEGFEVSNTAVKDHYAGRCRCTERDGR